jgi:hypothetical protein
VILALALLIGASLGACATTHVAPPAAAPPSSGPLPELPTGWPASFQLGSSDSPGGARALEQVAPFGFRYQYLAGGVNTGKGWSRWDPNGTFVTYYIQESRAAGVVPVFSYYQIVQSNPGAGRGAPAGIFANLTDSAVMAAYYADLKLFFERAGAAGGTTVLHIEPDLWAFLEQRASHDDANTVAVRVGSSGMPDVEGLPDNAAGFAQAIVRLRDRYAPNVLLAYHFSTWGTGTDIVYARPSDVTVTRLGVETARFEQSLGAHFDIAFTDLADRDAGFKQYVNHNSAAWYKPADYLRSTEYIAAFVRTSGLRAVLWQVPIGNTKMRAENNTWDHYQDNKVEWLLDDPSRTHLQAYTQAGVVAVLFGRGADGATCACDADHDGVTNPAPIDGNTRLSVSADDDGGYFKQQAAAYYAAGPVSLAP